MVISKAQMAAIANERLKISQKKFLLELESFSNEKFSDEEMDIAHNFIQEITGLCGKRNVVAQRNVEDIIKSLWEHGHRMPLDPRLVAAFSTSAKTEKLKTQLFLNEIKSKRYSLQEITL